MKAVAIAADVLREATARRMVLGLGVLMTLGLAAVGLGMKADLVDGALAGTRLFGSALTGRSPQEMLSPLFRAAAYVTFYAGLPFGILATADLAPRLLAPGRVEHLLSLPVRRAEILSGVWLGTLALTAACALYAALGLSLILFLKTGFLNFGPVAAALLGVVGFAALYAAMLGISVVVRSGAACGGVGMLLFTLGIAAGHRRELDRFFEAGWSRALFDAAMLPLPKLSTLAELGAAFAAGEPAASARAASLILGTAGFSVAVLLVAIAGFSRQDC